MHLEVIGHHRALVHTQLLQFAVCTQSTGELVT
jgi:hypothetical protein